MHIDLTDDQALVLFELLARFEVEEHVPEGHPSEAVVLADISCQLERRLSEPLKADYRTLVSEAQERIVSAQDRGAS